MKSEIKYILVSLGVVAVGVGVTASGVYSSNKQLAKFMETPVISNQEELETALAGEKQKYCLVNMPVSGSAVEDPLELLKDEYVYLYYGKEVCKEETSKTGAVTYTWESAADGTMEPVYAEDLQLFEQYPVIVTEYNVAYPASEDKQDTAGKLQPEQVKDEYQSLVDGYYYPEEIGDTSGNIRYNVVSVPEGQELAIYATVGDGEIVMEGNDDEASYVICGGTAEQLAGYFSGDAGLMRMLIGIMMIIPMGFIMLVTTVIFGITSLIAQKKQPKKGAKAPVKKK